MSSSKTRKGASINNIVDYTLPKLHTGKIGTSTSPVSIQQTEECGEKIYAGLHRQSFRQKEKSGHDYR